MLAMLSPLSLLAALEGFALRLVNVPLRGFDWEAGVLVGRSVAHPDDPHIAFTRFDDGGFALAIGQRWELLVGPLA